MDHFRALYKNSSVLSPKRCKRTQAKDVRAHKRSELYTSTRNISPSPQRNYVSHQEQDENVAPPINSINAGESAHKNNSPKPNADTKLSRQKAHLMKFLAWKTEKAKQAQIKEKSKRAPFITSTRNCPVTTFSESFAPIKKSFAPANHVFRPPSTLQSAEIKVMGSNSVGLVNGPLKEVFHFVATPKKKTYKPGNHLKNQKSVFPKSMAAAIVPASKTTVKPIPSKTPVPVIKVNKMQSTCKVQPFREATKKMDSLTPKPTIKPSSAKPPSCAKIIQKPLPFPTNKTPLPNKQSVPTVVQRTRPTAVLNPKPNLRSQISPRKNTFTKPKATLPAIKRPTFKAPKKTNSSISNAVAAVAGANKKGKPTGTSVLKTISGANKLAKTKQVPETPTDPNQDFAFLNVVTSTKRKSITTKDASNANSLFVEMGKLVSPVDDPATHKNEGQKFNFLRYSVVQDDDNKPEPEPVHTKTPEKVVHVTPERSAAHQTPTTYLSPYVSVSRGKVGIKAEREKRNSLYMSLDKSIVVEDHDATAKVRHTLATVHYYRKQLMDEIARLNEQCENWQQYKEANTDLVEDSGMDMINVTIGQTKLLTTKKLKQFGDLIDRCEDGVMGKKTLAKGEGAKPILPEDLEGFWSMVGLQIENVDKRFANLQRWKDNNWKDPDELPPKQVKQNGVAKKIKKRKPPATGTTAAPNKDLQKILRNAQAAFLRKKTANSGFEEDIILTPSKSRQVLIRDRRSRSAAATVITITTPKASRRSSPLDQTTPTGIISEPKLLPHINGFRKSMNLLKSTLLNKADKKSPAITECTSPLPVSRKSILKTPGSVRPAKSVIFNSPTLQFTMEDKVDDGSDSSNDSKKKKRNEDERMYSLRNRKIKLRDSSEFIIPR